MMSLHNAMNSCAKTVLLRGVAAALMLAILSGCSVPTVAPTVRPANMVPAVTNNFSPEANALFKGGVVVILREAKANNLETALTKTLIGAGWARAKQSDPMKYTITPIIQSEMPPTWGLEMSGSLIVNYVLRDATSKVIFDRVVSTNAKLGVGDVFNGAERRVLVIEKYSNLNISEFISSLDRFAKENYRVLLAEAFEKLKTYDLFSPVPFYVAFKPADYGNYKFAEIYGAAKSSLTPKLEAASLQQLKTFYQTYMASLGHEDRGWLEALIAKKETEAQALVPKPEAATKAVPPKKIQSAPKPEPTPKADSPKILQPETPKMLQPAPNPF